MDAILQDAHHDTGKEMYLDECDCTKARICRRECERREREARETTGNSTDDRNRRNTRTLKDDEQLRTELGMCPNKTNIDVRKLKRQDRANNMPKKRLLGIADKVGRGEVTKGRAGVRWARAVEKAWKATRVEGNQKQMVSMATFGNARQK